MLNNEKMFFIAGEKISVVVTYVHTDPMYRVVTSFIIRCIKTIHYYTFISSTFLIFYKATLLINEYLYVCPTVCPTLN